ncbi:ADP-ribosyl-[dinitrogen reductase] glycohydrolase [compost metagenome]
MSFQTDRVRGAFLGALVGDALGVPYEFHHQTEIPPQHLIEMTPPPGFERAHEGTPAGTWSDDGALLLAVQDSLRTDIELDLDDLAKRFLSWMTHGKYAPDGRVFDVGMQTQRALRRYRNGVPAHSCGLATEYDNGNGALMRVLPVAFHATSDDQAIELACRQGLPTHAHLRSQLCCAVYVLIARRLLAGGAVAGAYDDAVAQLSALLRTSDTCIEFDFHLALRKTGRGTGYVLDSLWSALDSVEKTSSYEDAVRYAIALGDDTDTTACLAGGLAGALYGVDGIPGRWLDALRGKAFALSVLEGR